MRKPTVTRTECTAGTVAKRLHADAITREVIALVSREFPANPGRVDAFDLPVTRAQALAALDDFATHRLPNFGSYQDAMRGGEPFLFHARLSGPLNLHLLRPREVLDTVLKTPVPVPLNAIEGFVRQILGWREFVRRLYWENMPAMRTATHWGLNCRCRASFGPAKRTCAAWRRRSAIPSTTPTRITSSG